MKKLFAIVGIAWLMTLTACNSNTAENIAYQTRVDDHKAMEASYNSLEQQHNALETQHNDLKKSHNRFFAAIPAPKTRSANAGMEARRATLLQQHRQILDTHAKRVKKHKDLEDSRMNGRAGDPTLEKEHIVMKAEHKNC